jgi:hypothetical protein
MEQKRSKFESDPVPAHARNAIKQAENLCDEHLFARARLLLLGVHEELTALGVESAFVVWLLAVACDSIGMLEEAIQYIAQARALDLAFTRIVASEQIIVGHVLTLLNAAGPYDPEVLSLLDALRRNFPANHPGLRLVEDRLAAAATDGENGRARAVA